MNLDLLGRLQRALQPKTTFDLAAYADGLNRQKMRPDDPTVQPAPAQVAPSLTSIILLNPNARRTVASIFNGSSGNLFLNFGQPAGTQAGTFVVKLVPGALYETPSPAWTGYIYGIWDALGSGFAEVAEQVEK